MAVAYDNIIYNSVMDEIERVLLDVRDEIRAKMASEGVNASGRTSAGMQVQRYESGVRLVLTGEDVAPLATLEVGRAGGKVPLGFADIIEQWLRDKGLAFPTEGDRRSFAYLTARKIARKIASKGTERHKSPIDIYSDEVLRGVARINQAIKVEITQYIHNLLTSM